jgi:hypothetical protein
MSALKKICLGLLSAVSLLIVVGVSTEAGEWKAGIARVAITPSEPMWMSGYGSRTKPSEGTLTELWAKALVLESPSGERVCLVSLDLVGISRDASLMVREKIKQRYKLETRQVALCCSHTHCGPVIRGNLDGQYSMHADKVQQISDYTDKLIEQIVSVVGDAVNALAPAKLAWGVGHSTMAVNRRENKEPEVPKLREAGLLKGPNDYDVPVLSIRSLDNKLVGVVFGYSCHATVMDFYKWSGDWPGFAMMHIERNHKGATALFFAGCGADQNPLPRRKESFLPHYGQLMGNAVDAVLAGHMDAISGELASASEEVPLPHDKLPSLQQLRADAVVPANAKPSQHIIAARARALLKVSADIGKPLSPTYPYPVQLWRFGNGPELVLLGGEVVVDYSLRFKRELTPGRTWVASYTNDVMAYIPSARVLKEGGYEGDTSMLFYLMPGKWGSAVEDILVKSVQKLHKQVMAPAK